MAKQDAKVGALKGAEAAAPAEDKLVLRSIEYAKKVFRVGGTAQAKFYQNDMDISCRVVDLQVQGGKASVFLESADHRYQLRRRLDILPSGVLVQYDVGECKLLNDGRTGDPGLGAKVQELLAKAEDVIIRGGGVMDVELLRQGLNVPGETVVPEDRKIRIRAVLAQLQKNQADAAAEMAKIELSRAKQAEAQRTAGNGGKAESEVIADSADEETEVVTLS